jgi:hypothetical protein
LRVTVGGNPTGLRTLSLLIVAMRLAYARR